VQSTAIFNSINKHRQKNQKGNPLLILYFIMSATAYTKWK